MIAFFVFYGIIIYINACPKISYSDIEKTL